MKVTATLAVALLSLAPAVSALSWPRWLPELDTLVVRQDNRNTAESPKPTASATDKNEEQKTSATSASTQSTKSGQVNLNTAGVSQTGKGSASGNATRTSPPRKTQFNVVDPPGSVVMVTPNVFAGNQLYKIGDYVTWQWNYTNLQGTPTAIDVLVTNTKASAMWTLTQNMTFTEVGKFTWDTNAYQQTAIASPLLSDMYTLIIHDADGTPTDRPDPGYLGPFNGFKFGMYERTPYTPSDQGYQCASCSGANGVGIDRKATGAAVIMSAVTVLSFTWFVAGFGGGLL